MIENKSLAKEKQPIEKLVSELKAKSIKLWIEDEFLRYKAPKGILTPEILKEMAERKEEIKNYLISSDFGDLFEKPIPKIEKKDYYTLSAAQKRMYLLSQIDSGSTAYNMTQVLKIEGELNLNHFTQVIEKLVKRHETLRTSFEIVEGKPVQKIHDKVDFKVEHIEMEEDKESIDRMIGEFIRPFDLAIPPLFRFKLVKLRKTSGTPVYLLLQDMHHIVSDGVSEGILVKEVNELYAGKELLELKIQYKDYAVWQELLLESEELAIQKKYWIEQLSTELPVLNLPTDFTRPIAFTYKGDSVLFSINRELVDKLYMLAKENRVTLYTVLIAAYNILLAKYTGQADIIIGTPSAGRRHSDIQNTLGVFINTLVLRNFPEADKTFNAFLQEVGANVLKVFDNQDYQFEQLVEELKIKRDPSRNPIFDTMFILQNVNVGSVKAEGLEISSYQFNQKMAQFDIQTIAVESKKGIDIEINYCTDLFKRETIERFGRHFTNILNIISENRQVQLHEIELLDNEEKDKIINQFNNTVAEFPVDSVLQELFEKQVEKTPNNTALVFGNKSLSYKVLNEKSNQLANVLRGKGVKPDDIVGIMVERSLEMVIGIMGILKAGGAYLPIDTEYPEERISYILEDCESKIVLTKKQFENKLRFAGEILDLEEERLYQGECSNLEKVNSPKDLAYVIYTSGSTGKPKGVMIEHGSAVNILLGLQQDYPLLEEDTFLLKTTYTFDISVAELFGWFYAGGRLAILEQGEEKNPQKVLEAIEQYKVTHINFVPSMLNLFLDICAKDKKHTLDKLKYILACGEALAKEVVNKFNKISSKVKLENIYGPTESTIYATKYSLSDSTYQDIVPIGKPMQNIKAYILDKNNSLQPIGVPGELCLGGKGIARGYINRSELTSSKFIPNPYCAGERIYRTGDLAKWLPDGNIEYLGRMDHQVKIRGFRIELGEIESQMLNLDYIDEAVVVAKEDAKSVGKYLCAYFVSDRELTVAQLKEHILKELPEYMVPSYFIRLEKMPLTSNGKIDRKKLPEPDTSFINTGAEFIPPRNEVEKSVAKIWCDVLGLNKVGIEDNFFNLGGDSIKAMDFVARAFEAGINLSVSDIFRHPTIKEMMENWKEASQQETCSQLEEVQEEYTSDDNHQVSVDRKEEALSFSEEMTEYPISKELKVVMQREITTYLHRSLPLCVILAYDKYLPWYYNNFIQVFSNTESNGYVEINYLEDRDCYIEIADVVCLGYHLLKNEKSILEFIIEKINMGYYLVMNVDEFYLPNKEEYQKNHFVHSSLIYGYDNNTKCLKAIGFNNQRLFTELTFEYSQFTDAYENGKIHYKKDAPWCDWSAVQLIRPNSFEGEFPFSITRFINELEQYLFSKSDLRRLYAFEYQPEQTEFGIKVYDVFVKNLSNLLDGNMTIDYRAVHLLSEHKKCLYDRIGYVIYRYQLSGEITELHKQYVEVVQLWNEIRIECFSQSLSEIDTASISEEQIAIFQNIINKINEVKTIEYEILQKVIDDLKEHLL